MEAVRILVIEDNEAYARLIQEMLKEVKGFSFHLERTELLSSGLDFLARGKTDVVLLDLTLPDSDGLSTFYRLFQRTPDVPIIVMTIHSNEEVGMKAVEHGAQDYLFKGEVDARLLVRSIRYAINRKQAEEALVVSNRFLEITNQHTQMKPLLQAVVTELKRTTGCTAVGVGILDEKGNITYQAYDGFSREFIEKHLLLEGDQYLWVIKGEIAHPFYTEGGSLAINSTSRFLATVSKEEKRPSCLLCSQFGYESLALVPICLGKRVFGLIHVADQRENMFPLSRVRILEKIAIQLGSAIERVQAGEELKKYRSRLEDLVKERTAELIRVNEHLQQEIIERRRSEELLRESEAKYSTLVEQAKDGVIIIQNGICKFCNRGMLNITGYSYQEIIDKPLSYIVMSDNQPCCLIREKTSLGCEMRIRCQDGKVKKVEASTTSIQYNDQGATLAIVRDVTERKKMEEELQKAQRLESLGILTGGIAHDFNNILVSIIGSFSLLKRHIKTGDKCFDYLVRAEKAALQARGLTRQLLTFSRGGAPIKKTASISELIEDTANFSLRGSRVRCEFVMPGNLWPVEIDEGQISQVINNLIINAQQAMPRGGIIRIDAENTIVEDKDGLPLTAGKYVKVSVKDQGLGIPKESLQRIFDPYFTTKKKGSGLGLATSYSIIKKHGGYITVESETGVGTTFYIYLPVFRKEMFMVKAVVEEEFFHGQGKILFMDDQKSVREMVSEMLASLGYEVECARDGREAIELYKKAKEAGEPFDALILDLTVAGGMGGQEAIRKLRKIDPLVKAIVSSGYASDPIMSEYRKYGFKGAMAKPYGIKKLGEVLYHLLVKKGETHLEV